ncbi:MAG: hypothetical protein HY855_11800 [Burkholderiales bacterium]|nr:hypothetical protein [Burkholderiales bacterium]
MAAADLSPVSFTSSSSRARHRHRRHLGAWATLLLPAVLCAGLAACGGGGGGMEPAPPPPPLALSTPGVAVIKARAVANGWVALAETLRRVENRTSPDRRLLVSTDGRNVSTVVAAPEGWSLIDVAVHPSGQLSLVLASDKALRLQRRTGAGALLGETAFTDAQAPGDPFVGDPRTAGDPQSLVPRGSRDAVRIAPLGEDLVIALRTGLNAVVAHRLTPAAGGTYARQWRTLVEPGVHIGSRGITSGTFDPFGSLDNPWKLQLDVDVQQRIAVAVNVDLTELAEGHALHFAEPAVALLGYGALATRLDAQGRRQGTTVVDTVQRSEIHAMRWAGERLLVAGRVLSERRADGHGWDGFVARLPQGGAGPASVQVIDVDRGDIVLDLAPMDDGRIQLAGATGYWQNPAGGSISEEAQPLLAVLPAGGGAAQRIPLAAGARHNQLRSVVAWQGRWLLGGLENGPGTHSADADPARLVADGYLRERAGTP